MDLKKKKKKGNGLSLSMIADLIKHVLLLLIRLYQLIISPLFPSSCRHTPSCSEYAKKAINQYGVIKGVVLSGKRICRCHPWGSFGYDPVKEQDYQD